MKEWRNSRGTHCRQTAISEAGSKEAVSLLWPVDSLLFCQTLERGPRLRGFPSRVRIRVPSQASMFLFLFRSSCSSCFHLPSSSFVHRRPLRFPPPVSLSSFYPCARFHLERSRSWKRRARELSRTLRWRRERVSFYWGGCAPAAAAGSSPSTSSSFFISNPGRSSVSWSST